MKYYIGLYLYSSSWLGTKACSIGSLCGQRKCVYCRPYRLSGWSSHLL